MVGQVLPYLLERRIDDLVLVLFDLFRRFIDVVCLVPSVSPTCRAREEAGRRGYGAGRVLPPARDMHTYFSLGVLCPRRPEAELAQVVFRLLGEGVEPCFGGLGQLCHFSGVILGSGMRCDPADDGLRGG